MSDLKIKFTYKPEGATPKVWTIDLLDDVKASEYIAARNASGIKGFQELYDGLLATDVLAIKCLLWLLLKKEMSTLSWDALDFSLGEIEVSDPDMTPEQEMAKLIELRKADNLNDLGQKRLAELEAEGVEVEPADPKA